MPVEGESQEYFHSRTDNLRRYVKYEEGQRAKVLARVDRMHRQEEESDMRIANAQTISDKLRDCIQAEAEMIARRVLVEKNMNDIGIKASKTYKQITRMTRHRGISPSCFLSSASSIG